MALRMDPYIIDTLMPDLVGHDRHPAAFMVFMYLWQHTTGGKAPVRRSLAEIAEGAGLSKRAVQSALGRLTKRKLVTLARESMTAVPEYNVLTPWRSPKRTRA